jgi:Stage II sporulation protein E (SpoIIE)
LRLGRAVVALSLLLCAFAHPGLGQTIAAHGSGGPARLDGPWLVYEGDPSGGPLASADPRAGRVVSLSPGSDSSQTGVQTATQAAKIIWLRATVIPEESVPNAALAVNLAANDCKVFVNGREAADCARWSRTAAFARRWMLVHVPTGPVQIAIRLVGPSGGAAILPRSGDVLFGRAAVLEAIRTAADAERFYRGLPQTLLCLCELIGGVILLLVFRYDRRRREYLWFAAFLFLDGTMSLESVFSYVYPLLPSRTLMLTNALGMMGRYAPLVGFIAAFMGVRLNRWMRGYMILLLAVPLLVGLPALFAESNWQAHLAYQAFGWILIILQLPFVVGSVGFLGWKWRKGNREAGLLFLPFLLASGIEVLGLTIPWFHEFRVGRFGFSFDDLSMFFFLISIGPVLLFRHRGITLEHARTTAELEAAREIQQRLVPQSIPVFPGYQMEAAYLPAEEVGGDFYQILAQPDGRVVLAIGDVSGKGLKAAMTGVLAIGALRTLAAEGLGPATILMRLNTQMVQAGSGGFITCFCAVLNTTGELRVANAGHLAPYLNGREIESPGTLPLGLDPGAEYEETTLALNPGDRITLLSDGVVEAQSATGELFGFERTCAISAQTAQRIAEEAQRFGQSDDITVLTLHQLAAV